MDEWLVAGSSCEHFQLQSCVVTASKTSRTANGLRAERSPFSKWSGVSNIFLHLSPIVWAM